MNWKPQLPDIFLGISLGTIAIEAALCRVDHDVTSSGG